MSTDHQALLDQIIAAIENDTLVLPTLPDIAIKIQHLIDEPNVTAEQIVRALASDPVISAQLIKAANSAAYADKRPVENVRGAVSRLGYRQLRNLVMMLTMNKMFYAKNPILNKYMKTTWQHSREVASISYVLALRQPRLSPDQAMLAGLVHEIGILPLCLHVETSRMQISESALEELIRKCGSTIGTKLLQKWNFPQDLIGVIAEHEKLERDSTCMPHPDYTDIISIANLQADPAHAETIEWQHIAAVKRLGLSEEECKNFIALYAARISTIAEMLGITATNPVSIVSPSASAHEHLATQNNHEDSQPGVLSFLRSALTSFLKK